MSRPPIGKRAMTPAQRQRRRRKRLHREKRAAEVMAKRAENMARAARHATPPGEWVSIPLPGRAPMATPQEEIAYQIWEMLRDYPDVSIDDVRDAIDQRFGPRAGRAAS